MIDVAELVVGMLRRQRIPDSVPDDVWADLNVLRMYMVRHCNHVAHTPELVRRTMRELAARTGRFSDVAIRLRKFEDSLSGGAK